MMDKKVYLLIDDIVLGYLTELFGEYKFTANKEGIEKAEKDHFIKIKLFELNKSGCKEYKEIPYIFSQFIPSRERTDIYVKADINEYDDDFEKLYKVAGLKLNPINFRIAQKV